MIAQKPRTTTHTFLLFIVSFTFIIVWLPLVRSIFDGSSYHWETGYFGFVMKGDGIGPHFGFLIAQLLLYSALFYSVYWQKNRKIAFGLLGIWFIHFFGSLIYEGLNGELMFHGDALNVHYDMTYLVVILGTISLGLILLAYKKDQALDLPCISWNKKNKLAAWIILGPLPIQLILLSTGDPQQNTDQIGVVISIIQANVIPFIFLPYGKRK